MGQWKETLQIEQFKAAQDIKPSPEGDLRMVHFVYNCYNSQGFGANKYARKSIEPLCDRLIAMGAKAEIRMVPNDRQGECNDFELWANVPEWQVDAIDKQVTIEDMVKACGRECHPQALMPFAFNHPAVKAWPGNV